MPNYSELTAGQRADFDLAFAKTDELLSDTILLVRRRIILTADPQEEKNLEVIRDALQMQQDANSAEYDSITFGHFSVLPPDPALVQKIRDLAEQVAKLTGQAERAQTAVNLARNALAVYAQLKG